MNQEAEKLRALLAEARGRVGSCECGDTACEPQAEFVRRLDAALAEPVEGFRLSEIKDAMRTAQTVEVAIQERDEARAEVERLKADLDTVDSDLQLAVKRLTAEVMRLQGAFKRGAEAMREAAAQHVGNYRIDAYDFFGREIKVSESSLPAVAEGVRALPIPEDK